MLEAPVVEAPVAISRWLMVAIPILSVLEDPVILTVPPPVMVTVPVVRKSPAKVRVFPPEAMATGLEPPWSKFPLNVGDPVNVNVVGLLICTLPRVAPEILGKFPFKKILPDPVLVWVPVPAMLPLTLRIFPPSLNVPEVNVKLPVMVRVNEPGKVTPTLLALITFAGAEEEGHSFAEAV